MRKEITEVAADAFGEISGKVELSHVLDVFLSAEEGTGLGLRKVMREYSLYIVSLNENYPEFCILYNEDIGCIDVDIEKVRRYNDHIQLLIDYSAPTFWNILNDDPILLPLEDFSKMDDSLLKRIKERLSIGQAETTYSLIPQKCKKEFEIQFINTGKVIEWTTQ